MPEGNPTNLLYYGDNLDILRRYVKDEVVYETVNAGGHRYQGGRMSSPATKTWVCGVALLLFFWNGAAFAEYGLHSSYQRLPGVEIIGPTTVRAPTTDQQTREAALERAPRPAALNPNHDATRAKPARIRAGRSESPDGWVTIKSEDFEGAFPNEWTLYGTPTWDDESYRYHNGGWSGYCVGSSVSPPGPYPPNASSWMVYGPFSLVGATDARLDFYRWLQTEQDYDYLYWVASVNDSNYYGYQISGSAQTWTSQYFDLKTVPTLGNLCGQSQVWIAFIFASDDINQYEGAYVDDVLLQKYTSADQPDLTYYQPSGWDFPIVPSNVTGTNTVPSPLPAGTTYIDWAGTNAGTAATTDTFFTYLYCDGTPLQGWYCAPPVNPGAWFGVEDYQTSIPAGNHTLMTLQDSTNRIAESNETNNRYSHSWTWGGGGGPYEHVTITSSALSASFAPLKSFLLDYLSLHDTVITTEYIYSSQSGRDNPEKIRNFIKYAYQNWQTSYVLLGGDVDAVPCRKAYGYVNVEPPAEDLLPCDLYYSDLDGDWDADADDTFGEVGDSVDMLPDVYVGRAPVSNATEASRFVTKTTTYGQGGSQHRQKVLLTGFDYDTYTHGEVTMDYYDSAYINSTFTCTKVYDSHGGNHEDSTRYYLNQGQHYYIHGDHGGVQILCTGSHHAWGLNNSDMSGLTNGFDKLTVFTTSACLIGAFDSSDCVMEAFMNAAGGGAVATMTNSRQGWYFPYENPQVSHSHAFVEKYVDRIFGHGTDPGEMKDFLLGKAELIGQASSNTAYRWCMYEYNLFGEPALKMDNVTGVQDAWAEPRRCRLRNMSVIPAVFARSATIEFELGCRSDVRLDVYDAGGRCIRTLLKGSHAPGRHGVPWDGRNEQGGEAPVGVYVVTLRTDGGSEARKVVRCAGKEQ